MSLKKNLISIALCVLTLTSLAHAEVYPWVDVHSSDIRVTEDPKVEALTRLKMVESAQKTIDIVIWDQRTDNDVGKPLLEALRRSADRGVKVRFLLSWSGHILEDPLNSSGKFLTNPATRVPIEFLIFGGTMMHLKGWGGFDGVHEKLFIVDGKRLLTTGRGHAGQYQQWLDTAFFIKGPLVEQAVEVFERVWAVCNIAYGNPVEPLPAEELAAPAELAMEVASIPKAPSTEENRQVEDTMKWWDQAPVVHLPPKNFFEVLFPKPAPVWKGRILHTNTIEQLKNIWDSEGIKPKHMNRKERLEKMEDPVIEEITHLLLDTDTKNFKFYTLASVLSPKLEAAILEGIKKGVNVEIFTNSKRSHQGIVPIPFSIGWYISLPCLDDLLSIGVKGHELLQKTPDSPLYLHRKLAVFDDTVIFGSHNLNVTSSVESDEVSFEIQGKEFAEQAGEIYDRSVAQNSEPLDPVKIHQERISSNWDQWAASYLARWY